MGSTSFPSGSHSTNGPSSSLTIPPEASAALFVNLLFSLKEEDDVGDLQASFFSSFTHLGLCKARMVESFISFKDMLREKAAFEAPQAASGVGHHKEE